MDPSPGPWAFHTHVYGLANVLLDRGGRVIGCHLPIGNGPLLEQAPGMVAATGAVVAVYVDPSATGQGVGRLIRARAVDLARDGHSGPIRVQSTLNATSFYEHHGFVEVKRATVSRNQVEVPIAVMERRAG
jgi:GNAT superfamily N-acetyltransferase